MENRACLHTVRWSEYSVQAHYYGSLIEHSATKGVLFQNSLLPSGTEIQQWSSLRDYQGHRIQPELPPLEGGRRYYIRSLHNCEPDRGLLLRLTFMDQSGEVLDQIHSEIRAVSFSCPPDTFSWTLSLVEGGAHVVRFHHVEIMLQDVFDSGQVWAPGEPIFAKKVLILEPLGKTMWLPAPEVLTALQDAICVPLPHVENEYLRKGLLEALGGKKVQFIGYGPRSDQGAWQCAEEYEEGRAWISGEEMAPEKLLAMPRVQIYSEEGASRMQKKIRSIGANEEASETEERMPGDRLIDYSYRLRELVDWM